MKSFWLFGGENYYPAGGMLDFIKSFDSLEEAKAADVPGEVGYRWAHVYHDGAVIAIFEEEKWSTS